MKLFVDLRTETMNSETPNTAMMTCSMMNVSTLKGFMNRKSIDFDFSRIAARSPPNEKGGVKV